MEDYLYQKDLHLPLSRKTKKPMSMTDREWDILDKNMKNTQIPLVTMITRIKDE